MTIAAGFRVSNGVIIGADTRIEEGNVKYEDNKVFNCLDTAEEHLGYSVTFAGAGDFEALSHCADLLRDCKFGKTDRTLRAFKERLREFIEGKRYLRLNDRLASTGGIAGIIALQSEAPRKTDLLYLSGENLYPIPEYKCIGAGSETALFVAKWLYKSSYPIRVFLPMAVQVFRAAKGHNAGCDDATRIIRLYDQGVQLEETQCRFGSGDADYLWGMHDMLGASIRGCFDLTVPHSAFEETINTLATRMRHIREVNDLLNANRSSGQGPELPKADSSLPLPSPESRGGSGES
jgi:hypothetical protein